MASRAPKMRQALAAANLINLGHPIERAAETSRAWAHRQRKRYLGEILSFRDGFILDEDLAAPAGQAHLYATFHYGLYGALYKALADQSGTFEVYSLIGSQSAEHQARLQETARQAGFEIRFVHSSRHMIRTLQEGLRGGRSAIILVDIPWGTDEATPPDVEYPAPGGAFRGRSTLARLLRLIDPDARFVCARRYGQVFRLERLGGADLAGAFRAFGEILIDDPAEYERLHELHHFFRFEAPTSALVSFEHDAVRYVLDAKAMTWWELGPNHGLQGAHLPDTAVIDDPVLCAEISKTIGASANVLISI